MDENTKALLLLETKKKSQIVAALLNLLLPGAGYAYCGRWLLGLIAFLFVAAIAVLSFGLAVAPLILLLIIDGYLAAGRYNNKLIQSLIKGSS